MSGLAWRMRLLAIALACAGTIAAQEEKPGKKGASSRKEKPAAKKEAPAEPAQSGEPASGKSEAAEGPDPEFRSPKGRESFEHGKELFEAENYKEALEEMKRAKEQAKAAADRSAVDRWLKACQGGVALTSYRKTAAAASGRQVLFTALSSLEAYRDTPIAPRYSLYVDEIWSKTLNILESFDNPSPRFSAKFGKTFITDKKLVFHGPSCLQWSSTKEGGVSQLKITEVPPRWTSYHSLVFWVRSDRPVDLQLMALSPVKSEERSAMEFAVPAPASTGWRLVEAPLDGWKKHGQGTFSSIEAFLIQIETKNSYKFYIDEIALVRKDGAEAAAADTKDDKKSKKAGKTPTGKAKQTQRKQG